MYMYFVCTCMCVIYSSTCGEHCTVHMYNLLFPVQWQSPRKERGRGLVAMETGMPDKTASGLGCTAGSQPPLLRGTPE